jgi:hypothetical protein
VSLASLIEFREVGSRDDPRLDYDVPRANGVSALAVPATPGKPQEYEHLDARFRDKDFEELRRGGLGCLECL